MRRTQLVLLLVTAGVAAGGVIHAVRQAGRDCPAGTTRFRMTGHHRATDGSWVTIEMATAAGAVPFSFVADPPATSLSGLLANRLEFGSGLATEDHPSSYMQSDSYRFFPDHRFEHEHRRGAPAAPTRTLATGTWSLVGADTACVSLDAPPR